ncbi:MAG: M48 family metalloprotease, partial [Gammaproteobacteria bacterium]
MSAAVRMLSLFFAFLLALQGVHVQAMSEKKEAEIGKKMYDEILAKMRVYDNPRVVEYINRLGEELVANSDRPELDFTFTVLDSPDINAFATPGAYIYVNRGLLAYLDSEAELAGVIAHEIAHVTERHASRQDWMNKGSAIGSAVVGILAAISTGSGALGSVTQDAASMAGTAMVRGYGRDMELEADR